MYAAEITIPLGDGSIVVENPQFIRAGASGAKVAGLTFTLANHTSSAWMMIDLNFRIRYVCGGEARERVESVRLGLGWTKETPIKREYHEHAIPLMGEVENCETKNIEAALVSATDLNNRHINGVAGNRTGPAGQEPATPSLDERGTQQRTKAVGDDNTAGTRESAKRSLSLGSEPKKTPKQARRKRAVEDQQRKRAEEEARAAKTRAEREQLAAEERRRQAEKDRNESFVVLLIVAIIIFFIVKHAISGRRSADAGSAIIPGPELVSPVAGSVSRYLPRPVEPVIAAPPAEGRRTAEWVGINDSVIVAGFRIPGLVYSGRNLRAINGYDPEPALIDPSKAVAPSTAGFNPESISYWPSYSSIEPAARHAYLKWHASGRSAADAPISFVFLYFYGLERRVLYDYGSKSERSEEYRLILDEVRRLLSSYGDNASFRRYASAFLEMAESVSLTLDTDGPPPEYPLLGYEIPSRLRIALGRMARDGKPIPPAWACAWVSADPYFPRRTPFSRCNRYFTELFALRYSEKWGAGIVVKPNKTLLCLQYRPASASFGGQVTASTSLPDITVLKEPIGKLRDLGTQCIDELDAYSRYLGRNPGSDAHPAAMALLPSVLLAESQTGEAKLVREGLAAKVNSGAFVTRDELAQLVKMPVNGGFAKREAVTLAQYLASMGFGMEPDVRFGGPVPAHDGKIYLFLAKPSAASAPTPAYSAASVLIHLAGIVSAADGTISSAEEEHLQGHIASALHLSEDERNRLSAHLRWVLVEQPSIAGAKKRIESLTAAQRQAIGRFLVGVANADGHVSPEELQTLGKLYRLLGLDPGDVYRDVHQAATEPVTVQPAAPDTGFALPPRKPKPKSAMVQLDAAMIEAKLQETAAVSALLASVFVEESSPTAATMSRAVQVGDSIAGLDLATSAFLRYVSSKRTWSREELEIAAAERALLLDGSIETINDAAFEVCDEPALEGDNPIEINVAVLSALLERTQTQ